MDESGGSVERSLSLELLEAGELALSEREADRLGMPRFHAPVRIRHDGNEFSAEWHPRERRLRGEDLLETLQLCGVADGLYRLHRDGETFELELIERGARTYRRIVPRGAPAPLSSDSDRLFEREGTLFAPTPGTSSGSGAPRPRVRRPKAPNRFRHRDRTEFDWSADNLVGLYRESVTRLVESMENGGWDDPDLFELRLRGEELAAVSSFDELLASGLAKVDHMPHQEATAIKVLANMQGRAILADEVGLGKTIEAGLIVKELMLRGLAQRVLILCPASLRQQWADEMKEKFDADFSVVWSGYDRVDSDLVIASLHLGVRNADRFAAAPWDLVIVDEAHRLAGAGARKSRSFVGGLETRYQLFLTATPVQNDLLELFRLVNLLRPGTFESEREFKRKFVSGQDPRQPRDQEALRQLVSDVMVRTTREQAGVDNVTRHAKDLAVELSPYERDLYGTITTVLREHLTEKGDHFRQRQLAHRLTTSPRGLALTARRVAESHSNPTIGRLLEPFVDLCTDTRLTNRQRTLLQLTDDWLNDRGEDERSSKGKVLVFTQHSETLEDLLRVYRDAGIEAIAYHGQLAPTARRSVIESFRRSAPVMISTESGAEGLNLQFCNCVINYDLPWNPMRIEQRIGRVHRLTQQRDVFVANLYAVDTIDEDVYRILHDKLRMFELLFGQVTTILGELDDRDDGTFEQRILNALVAKNDSEMQRRLSKLGDEADAARKDAANLIRTGSHLKWAADTSHRAGLTTKGATELQPHVEIGRRNMQANVERFAVELLEQLGAKVVFRTEHDPAGGEDSHPFVTVELPDDLADDFGRSTLHLAFTGTALANHADAELCTVGSEFFDELLLIVQERGDLVALMTPFPGVDGSNTTTHDPRVELVERRYIGPKEWAAQGTFRVRQVGSGTGDEVVTVFAGDARFFDVPTARALDDTEVLPQTVRPAEVAHAISAAAFADLEELAIEKSVELESAAELEAARMDEYFEQQLNERAMRANRAETRRRREEILADMHNVEAARDAYRRATSAEVELRADLLAVRVAGSPTLLIDEVWRLRNHDEVTFSLEWVPTSGPPVYRTGQGRTIQTLAICDHHHPVEAVDLRPCPGCDRDLCGDCGDVAVFRVCAGCGEPCCRDCLQASEALCPRCDVADRDASLDQDGLKGWRTPSGRILLVGERMAVVSSMDRAAPPQVVVPSEDLDDPLRRRLRRIAASMGLRPDLGVRLRDFDLRHPVPVEDPLARDLSVDVSWAVDTAGGTHAELPEPYDVDDLPQEDEEGDRATSDPLLDRLLARLREVDPPGPAPQLVGSPTVTITYVRLVGDGLLESLVVETPDGIEIDDERWCAFEPALDASGSVIASATSDLVLAFIRPVHRSYEVELELPDRSLVAFLPAAEGVTRRSEWAAERKREQLGLPPRTILGQAKPASIVADLADPASASLKRRSIRPEWHVDHDATFLTYVNGYLGDGAGEGPLADVDPLVSTETMELDHDLARNLFRTAERLDGGTAGEVVLNRWSRVDETWVGRSEASVSYLVPPGQPARPPLDDTGHPADDFGVDSRGHLHEPGVAWECPACGDLGCPACGPDDQLGSCASCGQPACGRCRRGEHNRSQIAPTRCERCSARSCGDCGRRVPVPKCVSCGRASCDQCRPGALCLTCSDFVELDDDEVAGLPEELHAVGMRVVGQRDDDALVVGLVGYARREIAVIRAQSATSWWTVAEPNKALSAGHLDLFWSLARWGDIRLDVPAVDDRWRKRSETDVVLDEGRQLHLTWRLGDEDDPTIWQSTIRVPLDGPKTRADILRSIDAACDRPTVRVPDVVDVHRRETVRGLLADVRPKRTLTLVIERHQLTERRLLSPDGLTVETTVTGRLESMTAPWSTSGVAADWWSGWRPEPTVVAACSTADVDVVLLRVGPVVVLGVDSPGEDRRLLTVADVESRHDALALGRFLYREDVAVYSANSMPAELVNPVLVRNATFVSTNHIPVSAPSTDPIDLAATHRVVSEWVPDGTITLPDFQSLALDPAQRAWLVAKAEEREVLPAARVVTMAIRSEDRWSAAAGEVLLSYLVTPEDPIGRVPVHDGGTAHEIWVDRSGHHIKAGLTCAYCQALTCASCELPTQPCSICQIHVCGRCSPTFPGASIVCSACSNLRRLGWSDRRRHPALKNQGKHVAYGSDRLHHVYLIGAGSSVRALIVDSASDGTGVPMQLGPDTPAAAAFSRVTGRRVGL